MVVKIHKLSELLVPKGYIRGPFGSSLKRSDMLNSGIPVYEQMNAIYDNREFRYFIDKDKFNELKRFKVEPGDLVLSCSGTVGKITIIKESDPTGIISQALLILRVDPSIVLPEYLKYFFMTKIGLNSLLERSIGSVQVNIAKREVIENIEVPIPSLDSQRNSISILSGLDYKIYLLKSINDNLDNQMMSLFKHMFSPTVVEQYSKLGDFCDVQKGLSYKGSGLSDDEGALLINLGNITPGGGYRKDKNKFYTGEYKDKNMVKPGDLIIANTDMTYDRIILGSPILVPDYPGVILFTHHLFAFRDVKLPVSYLYYYLRTDEFHGMCESSANGTTVLAITRDDVLDADIPLPTQSDLSLFDKAASKCLQLIATNEREISRLSALRDNLLPRLMSGEVDVSSLDLPTKYSFV